jgi:hypothetical protein
VAARSFVDPSRCKEEFSLAYVHAIAATAGYAFEYRRVDYFGVDAEILWGSFRIDVQMKCTDVGDQTKDLAYPLDARTFNLLTEPDRTVPSFLIVVEVPPVQMDWLALGRSRLSLLHCGYYREMRGLAQITPGTTKTVHLKRKHRLSVPALHHIMSESRAGRAVHPTNGPVLP